MAIGELFTPDDVAVTATPQAVVLQQGVTYALRNVDAANSIYWISKPSAIPQANVTTFAGTAAALKTLGASEIVAGGQAIIRSAPPFVHVVCATGLTAALKLDIGETATIGSASKTDWAALTAPGSTAAYTATVKGTAHVMSVTVATINTSVVVRFEGSVDNTNWYNMAAADTTISANTTVAITSSTLAPYVRGTFVSEAGGTDATVEFNYYGQR